MKNFRLVLLAAAMAFLGMVLSGCTKNKDTAQENPTENWEQEILNGMLGSYTGEQTAYVEFDLSDIPPRIASKYGLKEISKTQELLNAARCIQSDGVYSLHWKEQNGEDRGQYLIDLRVVSNGVLFNLKKSSRIAHIPLERTNWGSLRGELQQGSVKNHSLRVNGKKTKAYEGSYGTVEEDLSFTVYFQGYYYCYFKDEQEEYKLPVKITFYLEFRK